MRDVTAKLIHAAAEWVAAAKRQLPKEQRRAIDEYLVHDFKELVHDVAMHIAAADPRYVRKEDVPELVLDKEKEIARDRGATYVVLNARDEAVGFYRSLGYKIVGIGPTVALASAKAPLLVDKPAGAGGRTATP